MELKVQNNSSRILIEKADNGIIIYDIGEDNVVQSTQVYEIYIKDGRINYSVMSDVFFDVMEMMKFPIFEEDSNTRIEMIIERLDPTKPYLGEEGFEEEEEEDDDGE